MAHPQLPSSWEEFTILVETTGHDTICRVESFLDAIAVMYIDVDVQDSCVVPETRLMSFARADVIHGLTLAVRVYLTLCLWGHLSWEAIE